jgi:hypothetical protein
VAGSKGGGVSSRRQGTPPGGAWRSGVLLPAAWRSLAVGHAAPCALGAQWLPWARGVQEGCGAISKGSVISRLAEWPVRAACSWGVAPEVVVRGAVGQWHDVHAVPQQRCSGGLVAVPRRGLAAVPGKEASPSACLFLDCGLILRKKRGVLAKWQMFA